MKDILNSISFIMGLLSTLFALAVFSVSLRTLTNITPVDSLVKLAETEGCYKYLGWQNGHILKNLDTEELTSVWVKPIIRVQSCGESDD